MGTPRVQAVLRKSKYFQKMKTRPAEPYRSPHSDNPGGLNGSLQHLLAVYPPESQIPKSFVAADLEHFHK
jgi:hypothetical protein